MKKYTTKQILDKVVNNIAKKGRCISNGHCAYFNEQGNRCGHSLFVLAKYRIEFTEKTCYGGGGKTARHYIEKYGDQIHLKRAQGRSKDFWNKVQSFHDKEANWNRDNTISNDGKYEYSRLITVFEHLDEEIG